MNMDDISGLDGSNPSGGGGDQESITNQADLLARQLLQMGPDVTGREEGELDNVMGGGNDPHDPTSAIQDDDDIRNSLADIEESDELGSAVSQFLADAYNKTMTRPLSKENKERLKQELKLPENCTTFRVPKMNSEIWNRLPQKARMADLRYQQLQQTLSLGMTCLVKMSEELSQKAPQISKEILTKVFKIGLDGANLMGNQMQELNQKRKNEVKPYLNAECADICNAKIPVSEYLFGSNFTESLKSSKAASSIMRSTFPKHRYNPMSSSRTGPLNSARPFLPRRGSWSGQYPQQPMQYQQRNFQTPRMQTSYSPRMNHRSNFQQQKFQQK